MLALPMFTIGHSTHSASEFIALLTEHSIEQVVDVRRLPGSTRFPQFNADTLKASLRECDMTFWRSEGLTGRRPVSKTVPFEVNAWWQNRSFHNYADHALSREFHDALAELRRTSDSLRTAVMCSEAVWWR